jgi:hypothetical protein
MAKRIYPYSYNYTFLKAYPKFGIKIGDTMFFPKAKGDAGVKNGTLEFEGKYELVGSPGGTALQKVTKKK